MNHMMAILCGCICGYVTIGVICLAIAVLLMTFRWRKESGLCFDCFEDVLKEFDEWLSDNNMTKAEQARNATVFFVAWPREIPRRIKEFDVMFKEWFSDCCKERNI